MFVESYSGLMGGGKSYNAVLRMCEHMSRGGVCFTNIRLEPDPWFNDAYASSMKQFCLPDRFVGCRKEISKSGLQDVRIGDDYVYNSGGFKRVLRDRFRWNYQPGQYNYLDDDVVGTKLYELLPRGGLDKPVLVVIDEALDWFESGTSGAGLAEFRSFLRHVRKLGINLIFICQDFGALEKKIRCLTHFVWRFRDLYTWPVPVLHRPLPPPWRHHILSYQFHAGQFGLKKVDPINKSTWVYRDPCIFGCYQSIGLHNTTLKLAEDMQVDFGQSGKIERKGVKVGIYERIIIYGGFLVLAIMQFRSGSPGVEVVSDSEQSVSAAELVSVVEADPVINIVRRPISWVERGGRRVYMVGHNRVVPGGIHPDWGRVSRVSEYSIDFVDDDGTITQLRHTPGGPENGDSAEKI